MPFTRVLVRTVTGLEHLAAAELTSAGHRVLDLSKRQLVVDATQVILSEPPKLADDLFLIGASVDDPGRTKDALKALTRQLRRQLVVPLPHDEPFAVSASYVGKRTYNRYDVEDLVGAVIAERTGARYHSRRTSTPPEHRTDWRVVLDGDSVHVGVRPFPAPLHRRNWRQHTVPGSLHPPVAAAMAQLAGLEPGQVVLDPFCGAGTILIEAQRLEPGAEYVGADHAEASLRAAERNAASIQWQLGDAQSPQIAADRILTNPPWDVRLTIGNLTPYLNSWHHADSVVAIVNQHQVATLTGHPAWNTGSVHNLSLAGLHPTIVVLRR
ncbi:methyltransferase domain-containing protein [Kribbella italica]|uniref:23S rRNA G2445 N2-methylase RlmL n=1 Tax=Kribbella italica TaxID=1540520 RepID=A0A7W9J4Y9_9ACTN|nr:methyltransferase domain-containing protein [Kribbella italica]MBB5835210.1 23S rRNA G2445 N2-methylase RlmL [Kribbella italica]